MADAGELKGRATLDTLSFVKSIQDLVTESNTSTQAIGKSFDQIGTAFSGIADALGKIGIASAVGKFADECLAAASASGKLEAAFKGILGPSEETEKIFNQISDLELHSMFDFEDVLGPA